MSNYKTHTKFNLLLALPVLTAGIYYFLTPPHVYLGVFVGTFAYSTLFMTPDLDLVHQVKLRSLRGFFSLPFRYYSRFFRHRGLSHSLLFGSLTRILWLGGVALLIFYLIYQTLPSEKSFLLYFKKYKPFILYAFTGICLADGCHLLLDSKRFS